MTMLVRTLILFAAAMAMFGMSTDTRGAPGAPAVVTVLSDRFVVGNQDTDDLNTLEAEVRSSGARAIVLAACGPGTARPLLAAAQRFSDLYLELIVAAPDSSECIAAASPRSVPVSQRIGLRPFGIDDEKVNLWLMQIGGLEGGFETHAATDIPYGMPHAGWRVHVWSESACHRLRVRIRSQANEVSRFTHPPEAIFAVVSSMDAPGIAGGRESVCL